MLTFKQQIGILLLLAVFLVFVWFVTGSFLKEDENGKAEFPIYVPLLATGCIWVFFEVAYWGLVLVFGEI